MAVSIAKLKRELSEERKITLVLRGRVIAHGGRKKAPKLWRAYQRHKARISDLKVAIRRAKRRRSAPMRERAYLQAKALIGVMEKGGNNRGREVEKIIAEGGGLPGQAWCGWFVAACYRRAGSKMVTWKWGAVRLMVDAGLLRVKAPARGHVVRFNFDHTGLFVRWVDDDTIETIEGNTGATGAVSDSQTGGDGVYRKRRDIGLVRDFLRVPT